MCNALSFVHLYRHTIGLAPSRYNTPTDRWVTAKLFFYSTLVMDVTGRVHVLVWSSDYRS